MPTDPRLLALGYATATSMAHSHCPWQADTDHLIRAFSHHVVIVRDPRDVAVSWSRWIFTPFNLQHRPTLHATPDALLTDDLARRVTEWDMHQKSWLLDCAADLSLHLVFYEQLVDDTPRELGRIAQYLGLEVAADALRRVAAEHALGEMKKRQPHHVFRGGWGAWLEHLNDRQVHSAQRIAGQMMQALGYPLNRDASADWTPDQPGFVLLHGPAFDPAARLPRAAGVLDLVPLLWSACGFQTVARMPGCGLLPAIRAGHPQRVFDLPWQPHADHQSVALDDLLDLGAPHLTNHGGARPPEERWRPDSLGMLGRSLMARHETLRALPVLAALARLLPGESKAWLQLSDCQRMLGLMPEALDSAYAAVDARRGNNPGPLLQAATLEALGGQPDTARALLAQAAPQLASAPPQRRLQHANVLIFLREWPAATAMLTDIVATMPGDARALRRLARCHLALRAWQEAFDCAIESIKLDPASARAHELLAHALLGLGMRNQAWQALECAIAAAPDWPRPQAALAMLARRMAKPQAQLDGLSASYLQVKQLAHERRTALQEAARRLPAAGDLV